MKYKITIEGPKVHDVGYRPFLISLADDFDIQRFAVKNDIIDNKQVVICRVEGEEDQCQDFMQAIRTRMPKKAVVSAVACEIFEGRVSSITKTSMLNMNAQLAKGIAAIENVVERQDETIAEIRNMRSDLKENTNARLERVEADMRKVKTKLRIR